MDKAIDQLNTIIKESSNIVAFSGAGLSAESGIPTYRGAGGLWNEYDPDKYANINYFLHDPSYYWSFFRDVRYPILRDAEPNEGHIALAKLEGLGKCTTVITQNIDGLHFEAGQREVIELHGNTRRFYCMDCSNTLTMNEAFDLVNREVPARCPCGGLVRPDVVFFGESLPDDALDAAAQAAAACDAFLVLGSSLVVQPAAQLPVLAKRGGAQLVIINIGETPLDDMADIKFDDSASVILSQLVGLSH